MSCAAVKLLRRGEMKQLLWNDSRGSLPLRRTTFCVGINLVAKSIKVKALVSSEVITYRRPQ